MWLGRWMLTETREMVSAKKHSLRVGLFLLYFAGEHHLTISVLSHIDEPPRYIQSTQLLCQQANVVLINLFDLKDCLAYMINRVDPTPSCALHTDVIQTTETVAYTKTRYHGSFFSSGASSFSISIVLSSEKSSSRRGIIGDLKKYQDIPHSTAHSVSIRRQVSHVLGTAEGLPKKIGIPM